MADITLVNLNMLYIKYLDGQVRRQCHLPLGPLYLMSSLKQQGFDVDFRDYQTLEADELFSPEALCDFLKDPAPIIGLSCMANLIPFVLYAMPHIKARYPDSTIILGGVGTAVSDIWELKTGRRQAVAIDARRAAAALRSLSIQFTCSEFRFPAPPKTSTPIKCELP